MKEPITILIADDHPIVRKGLKQIMEEESNFSVIGEADDGLIAFNKIKQHRPKIVVLDINMPTMNGFEVARKLQQERLTIAIIFLTMYKESQMLEEALQIGAKGYVLKNSAPLDIVECIKTVITGESYISAALSGLLLKRRRQANAFVEQTPSLSSLTPAEIRILKYISEAKSSKEIAAELFISPRTVETHRVNICTKLQLHGSYALLKFALEHSLQLSAMESVI